VPERHRFDDHLVNALGYQTPRLLMERVRGALAQGHSAASSAQALMFDHAMDLGCGTGLSGEALRPLVTGTFQTGMSRCWQIRQCIRALGLKWGVCHIVRGVCLGMQDGWRASI
jgi:hypothetical protein